MCLMMGLGDLLKEAREKKNIRLADIASVTKVPLYQLKLIEENRWDSLPARPFVKGFLSAYCRYVGLNTDEIWQLYLSEVGGTQKDSSAAEAEPKETTLVSAPVPVSVRSKVFPVASLFGFLLILAFGGTAYWIIGVGKSESASETREVASVLSPEVPSQEAGSPEVSSIAEAIKQPEPVEKIAEAPVSMPVPVPVPVKVQEDKAVGEATEASVVRNGHRLEVEPREKTWVKIVIDDAPPVKLYLDANQKATYEAKNKIKLVLGNSTGALVTHNGSVDEGRVDQGAVKYYIFPRGSAFPQDKPREISSPALESSPKTSESVD